METGVKRPRLAIMEVDYISQATQTCEPSSSSSSTAVVELLPASEPLTNPESNDTTAMEDHHNSNNNQTIELVDATDTVRDIETIEVVAISQNMPPPIPKKLILKSILADEYTKSIKLELAYIATITDWTNISSTIAALKMQLTLPGMRHLKRVRKPEVLLCKKRDVYNFVAECFPIEDQPVLTNAATALRDLDPSQLVLLDILSNNDVMSDDHKAIVEIYLKAKGLHKDITKELCHYLKVKQVPATPVRLIWQFMEMNVMWPCKFHPHKYLEILYRNETFKPHEVAFSKTIVKIIEEFAKTLPDAEKNVGICVDPRTNSIVALALPKFKSNPIQHCPMVLIDLVARTQNGGALLENGGDQMEFLPNTNAKNLQGILKSDYELIAMKFPNIMMGAELIDPNQNNDIEITAASSTSNHNTEQSPARSNPHQHMEEHRISQSNLEIQPEPSGSQQNNLVKFGPYLCTGYDVYLLKEPCLMCSMGLTHSRVRNVFFIDRVSNGALVSTAKLHTVNDLNHNFEVFQCVLEDQ